MDDLLRLAIDGHGGAQRWARFSQFRARVSISGTIWQLKGRPGLLTDVVLEGGTRTPRLTIDPFPRPGLRAVWEPHRQIIETVEGDLVSQRDDPAAAFSGTIDRSSWDELQVAYFAAEANWNSFTAPFLFARDGFVVEETWPWRENGEVLRTMQVTYPDTIMAHTRQLTCYVDGSGLLRRQDYVADLLGDGPVVEYPTRYRRHDGIMVPGRRRVFVLDPDSSPILDPVAVEIDVDDISFR